MITMDKPDPEKARAALLFVEGAINGLRKDAASTVLCVALAKIGVALPLHRRESFAETCRSLISSCMVKEELKR